MATDTNRISPAALGVTLALTIALMYTLCFIAWTVWREPALDLLNALFHGLDFRRLVTVESKLGFWSFIAPLVVLSLWGLVTGVAFGVIGNRLRLRG